MINIYPVKKVKVKWFFSKGFKFKNYCLGVLGAILYILSPTFTYAKTIKVASIAALQTAIDNAQPGDEILLADGIYTTTGNIIVTKIGTAEKPITIAAQNKGKAEITGAAGFNLRAPVTYIIIRGFVFTHTSAKATLGVGSRFCRITQNVFETKGKGEYISVYGNDHQIDYNTFQNKNSLGQVFKIRGSGTQIAERLWIHHNYFYNFASQGGVNGAEAFQFGLAELSLSESNSIVEYNLFEKCAGENELISVKASGVILRYNTIKDCPAHLTLRHGNKCQVYGNYFINTPGLRLYGDDHIIHSNYFQNCNPAINIGNGGAEVADGAPLTSHDRPDRVFIGFNTLVNNEANIIQSKRENGLGATNITVAHNIIKGGGVAASIAGPTVNQKWIRNIIFNTKGSGDIPDTGFKSIDPKLTADVSGIFHLPKNSPLAGTITENIPAIPFDMDGQPRKFPLAPGADELSKEPVKAFVLTSKMVGANADIKVNAKK